MKRLIYHMVCRTLAFLPVAFAVVSATGQTEVYQYDTTPLSVEEMEGDTYKWDLYRDSTVNFAVADGDAVIPDEAYFENGIDNAATVNVVWQEPGIFFYRVMAWDSVKCTNNLKVGRIEILEAMPEVVLDGDSVCIGDPAFLTMHFKGKAPWNATYTNGTDTWTVSGITDSVYVESIEPPPVSTAEYWVTEVSDANGTNPDPSEKVEVIVYPKPEISRIYQVNKE